MAFPVDRRTFLKAAGATTASAYAASRAIPAWAASPDKGSVAVNPALSTFPYSAVQLHDGPMKQQFVSAVSWNSSFCVKRQPYRIRLAGYR